MGAQGTDSRESLPQTTTGLSTVCLSESLVSPWSPMLIRVTGWDYFGDSVGADSDLPLQIRRLPSIWFAGEPAGEWHPIGGLCRLGPVYSADDVVQYSGQSGLDS